MASLFRRKKIQLNPYNSVWDQKTSSWQPAPVGAVDPTTGSGPIAASNLTAQPAANLVNSSSVTGNDQPAMYAPLPPDQPSAGGSMPTGSSYGGFPTDGSGTSGSTDPTYSGFPPSPGSYGAFPVPGDLPAVGDQMHTPFSYAAFPPPSSVLPTPGPGPSFITPQNDTADAALNAPAAGAPGSQPNLVMGSNPPGSNLNAAAAGPDSSMIVGTNAPDGQLTSATGNAPELVSEHGGAVASGYSGTSSDLSAFNPPNLTTAQAKSEDMMATAPTSAPVNIPVTVDPGPPHAMVSADIKIESAAPAIPSDSVGSVAAGSVPAAAPVSNTVNSYDVGGSIVNPPITLPPSTANDTPATGLSSLNSSGVADTTLSNVHHPGMQE